MSKELIEAITKLTEVVVGQNERLTELEKDRAEKAKGPTPEEVKSFLKHIKS